MGKKFFLAIVLLVSLFILLTGCAKKKVITPVPQTQGEQTSVLTQEDLTKKANEGKAQPLTQGKVGEYVVETDNGRLEQEVAKGEGVNLPSEYEMELTKIIYFAFDSYELSEEAKDILKKKAEILLKYPEIKMVIEGHCDERGTDEYNLALGERRAKAAYDYLILLGVEADRLSIVSYGEEKPVDARHNEEAWAKNRRDEFRVVK